jgi:large subunit ribosomal protein L33
MAKASAREKIMLESSGTNKDGKATRYFYTTYKNKHNTTDKLELTKFDPRAWNPKTNSLGMHVKFKEKKIPK